MTKRVTPQDMFDMWQKMVNPGAYPLQSLMFPVLDPKEIEKKIAELEVVEHWLKANVNMIQLTTRSLQYQLALLKGGEKAQEVLARHYYRPISKAVLKKYAQRFPEIDLIEIQTIARDWNDAQERFFAEGGVFDQIQRKR